MRPLDAPRKARSQRAREPTIAEAGTGQFPTVRMRRNRRAAWSRRLVAESSLTASDLIWPIFLVDGAQRRVPIAHMPGIERVNIEEAVRDAEMARELGIPAIAPFPYVDSRLRDPSGSEALRGTNLMCRAVRAIKAAVPDIGIITDVALDIAEGADMVMVKPGMPYLDIVRRVKDAFGVPTMAYQVSGEYAMLTAAAANGWLDGDAVMLESLLAFKRAGADAILSYFAPRAARHVRG